MSSLPPHIFTLTGNLLAERTLDFDHWKPGGTFRAKRESFQVGGKGINVAKMLNHLGVANTALGFIGGATGAQSEAWLKERGFNVRLFETTQPTRLGTVVRAPGQRETTFLGPDVVPDEAVVRSCAEFLDAQSGGNILAICGSVPGWNGAAFEPLRDAFARWLSRGILVADTYGPPLAWLAEQPLELLKINASELSTIGLEPGPRIELAALRYVLTDGPNPVRYREGVGSEAVMSPPRVREVSATGSGDVMLACLLDALFCQRKSLREAVAYALPYAAANAADAGIAEFPNPI